jgi:kynurenine formamidase
MKNFFEGWKAVDLTHTLDEQVPTWTGSCGFRHEIKMDYPQGCRVLSYKCHAGVGTHIDAPSHFFPNGLNAGDIPLEQLIVPLCVLDFSFRSDPDLLISSTDIAEDEAKWGEIPKSSLVIAYTGWDQFWKERERYRNPDEEGRMHYPGFAKEAAQYLLTREISGLGIDTLSPDGTNRGFPVHEVILGEGKYIIENVAHLDQVPPRGAYAIALPLKVAAGAEAPMRLIALVNTGRG